MLVRNYEEAVEQLYPYLRDYLEEHGINTKGNFKCLSPDHDDEHPSCGIVPSGDAWHCFSCGASGTIFNAAAELEKLPISGPGFITETLTYLAHKYDVPLDHEPPTEEELYELDTYRAYRIASELIVSGQWAPEIERAIDDKGWSRSVCDTLGIGSIGDYRAFKESLKKAGFSAGFLDDIDLGREQLFGPGKLIFTIRSDDGRPVGFSSRDLNFDPTDKRKGPKYVNTGVKCGIYQKSKRLFGLDTYLSNKERASHPLYIMEGCSDVATAHQHGIWNSCGIGGTALTQDHIRLLKTKGIFEVVLCLDGDEAGQQATARILDTVLAGHKDLNVKIVIIPENMDPHDFITTYGADSFKKLKFQSAFQWRLGQFSPTTDGETICKAMLPLILNESSSVTQETMGRQLADHTGFLFKSIMNDLWKLAEERNDKREEAIRHLADKLVNDIKKDPENIQATIQEADSNLYDIAKRFETDAFSEASMIARVQALKEYEESLDGSFMGFTLGPSLHDLEQRLGGNWRRDVWMCLGGKPNSGKTSFANKLMYEIARHEEENDACIIYHSIDDTFEQVLPKLVCLANENVDFQINHVMNPNHAETKTSMNIKGMRQEGYQKIMGLMERGRIIVKDANDGISLAFADNMIRHYKEKYPDRNVIYILDNFHKLSDFQSAKGDERTRFKELSKHVKNLATKHHICVITTVEYRKTEKGKKAGNEDIGETGQIEYDANLIAHVYNELHELGPGATTVHRNNEERLPIIEVTIGKNKITGYKESMYFKFWPGSSMFEQASQGHVASLRKKEKERLDEDKSHIKEYFNQAIEEVRAANSQPGRAFFLLGEKLGLDADNPDQKQQLFDAWKYCGGKAAVEKALNA